ncbi:DUF2007 domain-containing protein [Vibrio sp. ZSDZ34]|uniref:DUF2007 domain-containing protein n=1 Tax=Vibrio gelatinilyticus TaxID=2893468 RepID=A0A9X1WEH1_9VIBR|nr:DUF2007 domain-containing protein [Vibrio gelatinilyticus]MCJ2377930.1 DUF2007 domain-containing protein [Vibrio gelatinilyticus]
MKIYIGSNPAETHIVCQLLNMENIHCEVRGEGLFGLQGEIPFDDSTQPYIWLDEPKKKSQALEVIYQFKLDQLKSNDTKTWLCQQCGETNDWQFAVCWHCEAIGSEQ